MHVALISLHVEPGMVERNLQRAESLIEEAARSAVDIVCLPEMVVVSDGHPHGQFRHLAEPIPGKYSDRFAAWAKEHAVHVVVGLMERAAEGCYSTAILIDPAGKILLKHRQVHNGAPYVAGDRFDCVDTSLGRIAVAICGDVFEERFQEALEDMRPDHVFVPMDWCPEDDEKASVSDEVPPRFLVEWKGRFREASVRAGASVYASNACAWDAETGCTACGGAFVFRNGEEIIGAGVAEKCWRQPVDNPIYVF